MNSFKRKNKSHPQETSNVLSRAFHWWTLDIIKKAHQKIFNLLDLSEPLKCDKAQRLGNQLQKNWKVQLSRSKPDLRKALFCTFWKIYLKTLALALIEITISVTIPLKLGLFLHSFTPESTSTFSETLGYALTLVGLDFLCHFVSSHTYFVGYHLSHKIHVALCSLIYRKAIKLSRAALNETSSGNIVNLMTRETLSFHMLIANSVKLLSTSVYILAMAAILHNLSDLAGIIGLLLVLKISTIQVLTINTSMKYRRKATEKAGERIRMIGEIVSGIQVLKVYTWEKLFASHVKKIRQAELQLARKAAYFRNMAWTLYMFVPRLAIYSTLIAMLVLHGRPTIQSIFASMPFFFLLNERLLVSYKGVGALKDCSVAARKIQSYLLLDEFTASGDGNIQQNMKLGYANKMFEPFSDDGIKKNSIDDEARNDFSIIMDNLSISWDKESTKNILEHVNLKLGKGKLYMVIGTVGSGKSSLLSSILKETKVSGGDIHTQGRLTYAGQDPWVFGDTIRQNILFGEPYDRLRYDEVLKACCLVEDVKNFVNGDRSVVGEKGISLSGGQKARINLARAIYRQADVYLLDDPLSAVDAYVSKRLFEECMQKFLRNKTLILATHQLQYIKDVDGIILVEKGTTCFYESYANLLCEHNEYRNIITVEESQISTNKANISSLKTSEDHWVRASRSMSEDDDARRLDDIIAKRPKTEQSGGLLVKYFKAGSNWHQILIMLLLFFATQAFVCYNDFFVLVFTNAEEARYHLNHTSESKTQSSQTFKNPYPTEVYVIAAVTLIVIILVLGIIRSVVFDTMCLRGSEKIHDSALQALIHTKMRFFHSNPSGRILDRFSKDIVILDEVLPTNLIDAGQIFSVLAGALIITCAVGPVFVLPAVFTIGVTYWMRAFFVQACTALTRLDSATRASIFTHLNETLNGITTIRAFQAENLLIWEFGRYLDLHTSVWYNYHSSTFAFGFVQKTFTDSFMLVIMLFFVYFKDNFQGGEVSLAITQVMCMTGMISYGSAVGTDAANNLGAVERLVEFSELPRETDQEPKQLSSKHWPNNGEIVFENVTMRYYSDEDPVLKCLNFRIQPQEKIGIVGRTGAGKSSLISALFRLSEIDGLIMIDGVDTGSIPMTILRSRISIIPQDPVLFSGTLRQNLDPFSEYPDSDLWNALEQVELNKIVAHEVRGLDSKIMDKGANYSLGQRQLICLARAILRRNRILVLDEATANVDPHTDLLIQKTIRTIFKSCTVLTIAHRLITIVDSDRVIVMDNGCLVEFDHPYKLLQQESGYFTKLVKEVGDATFQQFCSFSKSSRKIER